MKDMEVDTLSHISWSCTLTVHSENSKDLFSFPSTNETLGESRNRKKQKTQQQESHAKRTAEGANHSVKQQGSKCVNQGC